MVARGQSEGDMRSCLMHRISVWEDKILEIGVSLVAQWLRLHASTARGTGSIPDWGTKIPHATEQLGP